MLKQMKEATASAPGGESGSDLKDLSKAVLESSRQIWLAGLGAFSKAQAEGMKVFEGLVRQGEAFESSTKKAATQAATAARGAAKAKAQEMQALAGGTWDRLEHVFEARVARALSKLDIHTHDDVERLARRVDALSEAVNDLIKATGATPRSPPKGPKGVSKAPRKTARPAQRAAGRTR